MIKIYYLGKNNYRYRIDINDHDFALLFIYERTILYLFLLLFNFIFT